MTRRKLSHNDYEEARDMTRGKKHFKRNLKDSYKEKINKDFLDNLQKNLSIDEIEEEWEDLE